MREAIHAWSSLAISSGTLEIQWPKAADLQLGQSDAGEAGEHRRRRFGCRLRHPMALADQLNLDVVAFENIV